MIDSLFLFVDIVCMVYLMRWAANDDAPEDEK